MASTMAPAAAVVEVRARLILEATPLRGRSTMAGM